MVLHENVFEDDRNRFAYYDSLRQEGWYVPPYTFPFVEPMLRPATRLTRFPDFTDPSTRFSDKPDPEWASYQPTALAMRHTTIQTTEGWVTVSLHQNALVADLGAGAGKLSLHHAVDLPTKHAMYILIDLFPGHPAPDEVISIPFDAIPPNVRLLKHRIGDPSERIPTTLNHACDMLTSRNIFDLILAQVERGDFPIHNLIGDLARFMRVGAFFFFGQSVKKTQPYFTNSPIDRTDVRYIAALAQALATSQAHAFTVYFMKPGDNPIELEHSLIDVGNSAPQPVFAIYHGEK